MSRKSPTRKTPQIAFYVHSDAHAVGKAQADREGLSMATIARKAYLAYFGINADGTPRDAK